MRLVDLDPRWLMKDGKRVGFVFISPVQRVRHDGTYNPTPSRLTCFAVSFNQEDQEKIQQECLGEDLAKFTLYCREMYEWQITGGIETATFETMTVTPSLDASGAGLWHGFITNGEIVGGI